MQPQKEGGQWAETGGEFYHGDVVMMECCCLGPDLTVIPPAQGLCLSHLHPPCPELIIEPMHSKFSSGQEDKISQLFLSTVVVCIMPPPKVSTAWSLNLCMCCLI